MKLAEGTLPGLIISIMYKEDSPVDENFLLNKIHPRFEDLRKTNGSKYGVKHNLINFRMMLEKL